MQMGVSEMAGWSEKSGKIAKYTISEDELWSHFNFFFSDACKKRSTYKYGFLKAILDNFFSTIVTDSGVEISFNNLFEKFAENYWNLVTKYNLKQMRADGKSQFSRIETIFKSVEHDTSIISEFEFSSIIESERINIINQVTNECKKYVVGAMYTNFDGLLYGFDLKEEKIWINPLAYDFMMKYKIELEKLNYYAWAKELEKYNCDDVLARVLDKLEISTPHRNNLSVYRDILKNEFEENNCFYCGKKLTKACHVDHFIPWQLVRENRIWNFVLACPECNLKKNNKIPNNDFLYKICKRNTEMITINRKNINQDFQGYSNDMMKRLWNYAKMGGYKEM